VCVPLVIAVVRYWGLLSEADKLHASDKAKLSKQAEEHEKQLAEQAGVIDRLQGLVEKIMEDVSDDESSPTWLSWAVEHFGAKTKETLLGYVTAGNAINAVNLVTGYNVSGKKYYKGGQFMPGGKRALKKRGCLGVKGPQQLVPEGGKNLRCLAK
jgi:hypothetical protein